MNYSLISITSAEFQKFKLWLLASAGIDLKDSKEKLVEGRLAKRLNYYHLESYDAYFNMVTAANGSVEAQIAVDLLTTNETYFFREPKHFEFLSEQLLPRVQKGQYFRLWCAASSTGEEPYTLAMTLAEGLQGTPWQMLASDINLQVLETASAGHYPVERAHNIPKHLLCKYCLKGNGTQEGTFLIQDELRQKITFKQINLIKALPEMDKFDVIFLRNVMIYFNNETRIKVIGQLLALLKPAGYLVVSHSESLVGINTQLTMVQPSIFIKS